MATQAAIDKKFALMRLYDSRMSKDHPNVVAETLALIKRVIDNVINNLDDPKYREVKIKAKPFQKSIIPVDGALDFLIECGFVKRVISFEECLCIVGDPIAPATLNALVLASHLVGELQKKAEDKKIKRQAADHKIANEEKEIRETLILQTEADRRERAEQQAARAAARNASLKWTGPVTPPGSPKPSGGH